MNDSEQEANTLCERTFVRNIIWNRLWNKINDGHWAMGYNEARLSADAVLDAIESAGYKVVKA